MWSRPEPRSSSTLTCALMLLPINAGAAGNARASHTSAARHCGNDRRHLHVKVLLFVVPLVLSISQLAVDADHAGGGARGVRHQNAHVPLLTARSACLHRHQVFEAARVLLCVIILFIYAQSF